MIHVSFALTAEAFADGTKTETRRFGKSARAAKFMPRGELMGITKEGMPVTHEFFAAMHTARTR